MPGLWDFLRSEADRQGVDQQLAANVMDAESGGRVGLVSSAGAVGPMQLMPGTARDLGVDPNDPEDNIRGGVRYLRQLSDQFGSPALVAAAYNAGPGRVRRAGGVPNIPETRAYVAKVTGQGADAGAPDVSDIFSDNPSAATAAPSAAAQGGGADVSDIFADPPASAAPAATPAATPAAPAPAFDPRFVNADTGEPLPKTQGDAIAALMQEKDASGLPRFTVNGTSVTYNNQPFKVQTDRTTPDIPGAYYMDQQGQLHQVPGLAGDVAQGAVTGLREGATATLGAPGSLGELWDKTVMGAGTWAAQHLGLLSPDAAARMKGAMPYQPATGDADTMAQADEKLFGQRYMPRSGYGEAARTLGQMAPNALTGGEGAAAKAVSVIAPAVGSEAAGLLAHDTPYEGAARVAGAFAGGAMAPWGESLLPGAATRRINAGLDPALRAVDDLGVDASAMTPPNVQAQTPGQLTPQSVRIRESVRDLVGQGYHPEDAAVMAAAQTLPVPIPLTRGLITNDPAEQLSENMALRGAKGPGASREAQMAAAARQQALRGNVDSITDQLGGGRTPQPGQAGAEVSGVLNDSYDAAHADVNANYDEARQSGPAAVHGDDRVVVARSLAQSLADFDELKVPHVYREASRIIALGDAQGDLPIRDMYDARARLTKLRTSNDPVEAAAAARAVGGFDSTMSDLLAHDLLVGDPDAVNRWRTAIGSRRDFGQLFEGDDLINRLTERAPRGGQMQLKVDPSDATNYIFGRAGLGFVGKQNLSRDMERLRGVLGADSPSWNQLRAEAFSRFAQAGEGAMEGGVRQFSGVKFQKAWQDAQRTEPRLLGVLFGPQDRQLIDQFGTVAARLGGVKGGDNSSNSGVTAYALMKKLMVAPWNIGKATPVLNKVLDGVEETYNTAKTRRAVSGTAGRRITPPVFSPLAPQAIGAGVLGVTAPTPAGLMAYQPDQ